MGILDGMRSIRLREANRRCILLLAMLVFAQSAVGQENWPRFRGENGVGVSDQKGFPVTWSNDDYAWNIEVPGKGHSSPVIWRNRLFLTTATKSGGQSARQLLCIDPATGKTIWKKQIGLDSSHLHRKNSWASGTPATDGSLVFVVFADEEKHVLAAYDFDGNETWRICDFTRTIKKVASRYRHPSGAEFARPPKELKGHIQAAELNHRLQRIP